MLGPGSATTIAEVVAFVRGGPFRSAWHVKPSQSDHENILRGFNWGAFYSHLRRILLITMPVYWRARVMPTPCLASLNPYMIPLLNREVPSIWIENALCEVVRRRARALAYACGILKILPKGTMRLAFIFDPCPMQVRTLSNMRVLVRSGSCVLSVGICSLDA